MTQIKKSTELLKAASPSDLSSIVGVSATGQLLSATADQVRSALMQGIDLGCIMDGVFVIYWPKNSDRTFMVKPHEWTALQNAGQTAIGVVVISGSKPLIVAPTEASELLWSSAGIKGGAVMTTNRLEAIADNGGKRNTEAIIAAGTTTAVTNTADYAPGFCSLYSRANADGNGIAAGNWWLPSVGELLTIFANRSRINYCLSLIHGATLLTDDIYWASTEYTNSDAWFINMRNGDVNRYSTKYNRLCSVRPISELLQ